MRWGPSGRGRRRRMRRGGCHVGLWARGRRAWSSWFHRCRGRPRRSGPRRRCGSCRRCGVGARRSRRPPCRGRRRQGRMPGRCRRRSPWDNSGRHWPRSRPRRRSGRLSGRRVSRGPFCRRLCLSLRMGFLPLLRLRHDQRRALGVRWETCKLHRRQGGRGKQRKTKSGHLILIPRVKNGAAGSTNTGWAAMWRPCRWIPIYFLGDGTRMEPCSRAVQTVFQGLPAKRGRGVGTCCFGIFPASE